MLKVVSMGLNLSQDPAQTSATPGFKFKEDEREDDKVAVCFLTSDGMQ